MMNLFPFLFLGFGAFVLFMMRLMVQNSSGWLDLELKYKTLQKPRETNGKNLKISSCNFGGIQVNNLFKFYDTYDGLLITPIWIVRKNENNLLIPWNEIVDCRERKMLFGKMFRLIIGDPFVSFIDLSGKDFEKIKNRIRVFR